MLERAFGTINAEAELDVEGFWEDSEVEPDRLIGFAEDSEGRPIGPVAGRAGIWRVSNFQLFRTAESVESWLQTQLEELEENGQPELCRRVRDLLSTRATDGA